MLDCSKPIVSAMHGPAVGAHLVKRMLEGAPAERDDSAAIAGDRNHQPVPEPIDDLAAVVALVGWSILELIVLWIAGIFRREPA